MKIFDFVNLPVFNTIITLIVGAGLYIMYKIQKRNKKTEAAGVLLMEIRRAEKTLEHLSKFPIDIHIILVALPSNNWVNYAHLFIDDFDSDQIDEINEFYSNCSSIDKAMNQISIEHQLSAKMQSFYSSISRLALDSKGDKSKYENDKKILKDLLLSDEDVVLFNSPIIAVKKLIASTNKISTTPIGVMLKKIAKRRD